MTLRIQRAVLDDILAHAHEGKPDEVCGILVGRAQGEVREVLRHYRTRNAHPRPRGEYLIDPQEQLRITLEAEDDLGLEVIGFYHSHPAGPARLSATDAARASWPGASYLLVWLRPEEGVGSSTWDATKGRFESEALEVA